MFNYPMLPFPDELEPFPRSCTNSETDFPTNQTGTTPFNTQTDTSLFNSDMWEANCYTSYYDNVKSFIYDDDIIINSIPPFIQNDTVLFQNSSPRVLPKIGNGDRVVSIEDQKGKRRFSPSQKNILNRWFNDHIEKPYADSKQLEKLSALTGLERKQILTYFVNKRVRSGLTAKSQQPKCNIIGLNQPSKDHIKEGPKLL